MSTRHDLPLSQPHLRSDRRRAAAALLPSPRQPAGIALAVAERDRRHGRRTDFLLPQTEITLKTRRR
jgi:hypothetical protein